MGSMPSRKEIDLQKVLASLDRNCPKCGYEITPAEMKRVSWDEIECPACHAQFDAGKRGPQGPSNE